MSGTQDWLLSRCEAEARSSSGHLVELLTVQSVVAECVEDVVEAFRCNELAAARREVEVVRLEAEVAAAERDAALAERERVQLEQDRLRDEVRSIYVSGGSQLRRRRLQCSSCVLGDVSGAPGRCYFACDECVPRLL